MTRFRDLDTGKIITREDVQNEFMELQAMGEYPEYDWPTYWANVCEDTARNQNNLEFI